MKIPSPIHTEKSENSATTDKSFNIPATPPQPLPAAVDPQQPAQRVTRVDSKVFAEIVRNEVRTALAEFFGQPSPHPRQFNYERLANMRAAMDSADYLIAHMLGASDLVTADAVRQHSLERCTVPGLIMEFGVFDGASLSKIAATTKQQVHGFDSFEGLPEDWTHFQKKGRFSRSGELPKLSATNVSLHKGWFQDTLPQFLNQNAGPARFVHIDCDLYSSTTTVLGLLTDRIVSGTIIVFDEYLNYPGWQQHEQKAFAEFLARTGKQYKYLGFASNEFAVSVQIL